LTFAPYLKETGCEAVNWINLVKDNEQWCTPVSMVMNLWFA